MGDDVSRGDKGGDMSPPGVTPAPIICGRTWSKSELADVLGVSVRTIQRHVSQGDIAREVRDGVGVYRPLNTSWVRGRHRGVTCHPSGVTPMTRGGDMSPPGEKLEELSEEIRQLAGVVEKLRESTQERPRDEEEDVSDTRSTDRPPGVRGVLVGLLMWLKSLLDAILKALRD